MQEQIDRLAQELHELRSDHGRDITDLYRKVRDLEARVNQEESDRQSADTTLEDWIARIE